jgi:hypothetical protein
VDHDLCGAFDLLCWACMKSIWNKELGAMVVHQSALGMQTCMKSCCRCFGRLCLRVMV